MRTWARKSLPASSRNAMWWRCGSEPPNWGLRLSPLTRLKGPRDLRVACAGRAACQTNYRRRRGVSQKKLDLSLTRSERLRLLEREQAELPLTTQTELLSLNRTSLYYTSVAPSPQEVALKHRIDVIYTERPYYGVRRITAQLRREGILVNHKA